MHAFCYALLSQAWLKVLQLQRKMSCQYFRDFLGIAPSIPYACRGLPYVARCSGRWCPPFSFAPVGLTHLPPHKHTHTHSCWLTYQCPFIAPFSVCPCSSPCFEPSHFHFTKDGDTGNMDRTRDYGLAGRSEIYPSYSFRVSLRIWPLHLRQRNCTSIGIHTGSACSGA